ncbi:MAG: type II secretion system protein GspL [Gammaproteobacteria bacterium]|nr:type II secretion system protein GspL [Gammaproteobacteria bacterium]
MAGQLLLRFTAAGGDDAVEWAVVDARGKVPGEIRTGSLTEAAAACTGRSVVVIISGADALLSGARVPGRNRNRVRAAIPYALEEGLVEDVSAYHFVSGRPDPNGVYPTVVVLRSFMDRLLERLNKAGIQAVRVLSEAQLLGEDAWTVLVDGQRALVRLGTTRGFATELDALPLLLETARGETPTESDKDVPLAFYGDPQAIEDLRGYAVQLRPVDSVLGVLAPGVVRGLNLLQSDYSPGTQIKRVLRQYRLSAALAAVLLILVCTLGVMEYRQIHTENARLQVEIEAVLKRTFPDLRRVVNPRAQMRQRLLALRKEQRTDGGFLELLTAASGPLAALTEVQLNGLVYRRGRLELDLEARELRNLDALQQEITKVRALSASIESAKSDQQKVRGRLRIVRADPS